MNPCCFEQKLLDFLLEREYDVILPLSREEDEKFLKQDLEEEVLNRVHVFRCDFSNLDDAQMFQTYLFERWYPLDAVFVNFYHHYPEVKVLDLSNEFMTGLLSQGIIPSMNFLQCVYPMINSKGANVLLFSIAKEAESRSADFANKMIRSMKAILREIIIAENDNPLIKIGHFDILIPSPECKDELEEMSEVKLARVFSNITDFLEQGALFRERFHLIPFGR